MTGLVEHILECCDEIHVISEMSPFIFWFDFFSSFIPFDLVYFSHSLSLLSLRMMFLMSNDKPHPPF
jgi:hypothetical protein